MIGTTVSHYRVAYDTGQNIARPDLIRESLDWLDKYLGPVEVAAWRGRP